MTANLYSTTYANESRLLFSFLRSSYYKCHAKVSLTMNQFQSPRLLDSLSLSLPQTWMLIIQSVNATNTHPAYNIHSTHYSRQSRHDVYNSVTPKKLHRCRENKSFFRVTNWSATKDGPNFYRFCSLNISCVCQ